MSDEAERTCPLCAEEMDLTDQQLKPCRCGYEICVWCWHHIMDMAEKDDSEGRCPACRNPYDKKKIVGMAANCERLVAEIHMERKKSQKTKTKPSEARKQLSSVRVIQRNLVYIVGLPLNLADEDLLQHREYFGQYGKVLKVSMSRTATGVIQQFPNNTCSVYITYSKEEEAIRCIQCVHGFVLDGRSLKACFGTTKYCHAWLRNVPCTNPDCLYLHEIGSQEDSFTKDEIISAYTRVQQITGTTNSTLRRSGSMLPPPLDDCSCSITASAAKSIVQSNSNNSMNTSKGSPPNGSLGKSVALPAAASWGTRVSSQPQTANSTQSNGPPKPKPDIINYTLAFSSAAATSTQPSSLHCEIGKSAVWNEDGQSFANKGKPDNSKPVKQNNGLDFQVSILEKPGMNEITATLTSSNQSSSSLTYKQNNLGSDKVSDGSDAVEIESSSESEKGVVVVTYNPSIKVDSNIRCDITGVTRTNGAEQGTVVSPGSNGLHQQYVDQYREPLALAANQINSSSVDQSDWKAEPHDLTSTNSAVEEDIMSFDNQRLNDPEVVSHTSFLPSSANSLHYSYHSRSHSLQHNELFGTLNSNPLYVDTRVGDRSLLHSSSNNMIANGYPENLLSSSSGFDRNIERTLSLTNEGEGKPNRRSHGDSIALDVGESSIISNILSLDLDSWDDSLTSPQNLAKLLGETDRQPSLKMSSSWKNQGNCQSRFSFARHEEPIKEVVDVDPPFSIFGQLQNNLPYGQDFSEKRNSYMDKNGMGNGFSSSNFEESEAFTSGPSIFASNKSSVSRAPPGFSVPNRAPPPGFCSRERLDQMFDTIPGNHMLDSSSLVRNPYQASSAGNISSNGGDIEFIDPAILAVGKGRLQAGLNNSSFDMRSNFPQQLSAFDSDARLKLLMRSSHSPNQNLRYADLGNGFSSLNDSYGINSRLADQSQISNISPYMQMSLQHSRNGIMSNGHWDGWNERQAGSVAELILNERPGFNKFYNYRV